MQLNKSGFTLVEIAVTLALAMTVTLAIVSYNSNLRGAKKRIVLVNTLVEKKINFDRLLGEKETFINTKNAIDNYGMDCLRLLNDCPTLQVAAAYNSSLDRIILYDNSPAPGAPVYDGRATHNTGYTEDGTACTGFVETGSGNDRCPIGYIVNWYVNTPSSFNGVRLTINAKLIFNPSASHPMRKVINSSSSAPMGSYDSWATRAIDSKTNTTLTSCEQSGITLYNATTYPFYQFNTVALGTKCESENRTCTIINDVPNMTGSFIYPTCAQNCYGEWSPCSRACGGGTQLFRYIVPPNNWGAPCAVADGAAQVCNTQVCPPAQDCTGTWSACSAACGGGTQTFTMVTPATGGGAACPTSPRLCNSQSCSFATDCAGTWSACSVNCGGGTRNFTVTTVPANGGAACPVSPEACNTQLCSSVIDCNGTWSTCSASCGGGTRNFTITQTPANGGAACPASPEICNSGACPPVNCVGSWSACVSNWQTYTITTPAANGGLPCPTANGAGQFCTPACDPRNGTMGTRMAQESINDGQYAFVDVWCCAGRLPYPSVCGVSAGDPNVPGSYILQQLNSYYQVTPNVDQWNVTCDTTFACRYDCDGNCN